MPFLVCVLLAPTHLTHTRTQTPTLRLTFQPPNHPTRPNRSEIRQVPDNQEVFVDQASDASLILELLELERGRPGPEVGALGVGMEVGGQSIGWSVRRSID